MAVSTNNTFPGTPATYISTIANWVLAPGGSANTATNGTDAYPYASVLGHYYDTNFTPTVDGEKYELAFTKLDTTAYQCGPMGRCKTDGSGYLFTIDNTGAASLYRYDGTSIVGLNGGTPIATGVTVSVGAHVMKLVITGTGASVALSAYLDGTQVGSTVNDTAANRITTLGYRGLWAYGTNNGSTTGVTFQSITATDGGSAAATFALTGATAVDGFVAQRSGTTGTLVFTGTYTGTPASIEARLVATGTSTAVTGFDWSTKVASPSGSAFSFSFTGVPQGGFYQLQLRDSAVPATITTPSNSFAVGMRVALIGQSNVETLSMLGTGTPNAKVRFYDRWRNAGTWSSSTTGAGAIAMANAIFAANGGIPVALIQYAVSGAGLHAGTGIATTTSGGVARYWLDATASVGTPWYDFATAMALIGPTAELVVYGQGESDAITNTNTGTYGADLITLFASIRTLLGAGTKIILPLLGQSNYGSPTDAVWNTVLQAQIATAASQTAIYPVSKPDLQCDAGSPDMSQASVLTWGSRLAQKINHLLGYVAYSDGPSISTVIPITSTVYEMTLVHAGGTDFTPLATTQITDLLIKDGATVLTPTDISRYAANKIRFTLATAPAGTVTVTVQFGKVPTNQAGVVLDNSALNLPLVSSAPITAAAGSTVTTVTVSPSTATVAGAGAQTFTASVAGTGSPSQSVTWSASAGSITSGGVFTAPAATGSAQTVTVTATSVQDGTKSGTSTVTVPATVSLTMTLTTDGSAHVGAYSSVRWAWWDASPPNFGAPATNYGSGATISSSGVISVPLPNSAFSSGQIGTAAILIDDNIPGSAADYAFIGPWAAV